MSEDPSKFRRQLPHLSREIFSNAMSLSVGARNPCSSPAENSVPSPTREELEPDVIRFIRRCDNESQALEIIDYIEKRGEISTAEGDALRRQLTERGLRSFGSKLKPGYYLRHGNR